MRRHPSESRDPVSLSFLEKSHWMMRRFPRRPLRVIGYADVRYGFLPARACFRRNDEKERTLAYAAGWRGRRT
jgi:hypothetical protein